MVNDPWKSIRQIRRIKAVTVVKTHKSALSVGVIFGLNRSKMPLLLAEYGV